jgi:hypothetical protein
MRAEASETLSLVRKEMGLDYSSRLVAKPSNGVEPIQAMNGLAFM